MSAAGWSEDALHRWLASEPGPEILVGGALHDAAVLARVAGHPVLCADQCIEGVHFSAGAPAEAAGAKAVLRTLSDLAAAAARPVAVTLALRAPKEVSEERMRDFVRGARDAAARHGGSLVGGDLAMAPGPVGLSVTALGDFGGALPSPSRARAAVGEIVLVSGPLGGSFGSGRHIRIVPRIAEGRAAHDAGASALMDVSDGLAWDLFRLARTAGVAVELDLDAVPVHADAHAVATPERSALDCALHDGEDHELIATIAPEAWRSAAEGALRGWTAIGRVVGGSGLTLHRPPGGGDNRAQRWSPERGGWTHGDPWTST